MSDTRPLWLLDFDGVINVNPGKPGWGAAPRRTRLYVSSGGVSLGDYLVRWAPALVDRIRALHASGLVEIQWASTWIGHTDLIERTLGLPDFEDAYVMHGAYSHNQRKLHAALDATARGRRVIWTDDEAIPADGSSRKALDDAGALLIAPRPNRGLQPEHLTAIEAFVEQPRCESQGCRCSPSLPCDESGCDGQQHDDGSGVACTMCMRERAEMTEQR